MSAIRAQAGSATLTWDPNTEPDLAGYLVSYGTQPGVYGTTIDVGNQTTWTTNALANNQHYYFVVQAYNLSGLSSAFSPEVDAIVQPPAAPTVASVSPASGPIAGGTAVTITGTNFRANAVAYFGTVAAASTVVVNATTLSVVTPAVSAAGVVDVRVTNADSTTAALTAGFTYIDPRVTVTAVLPGAGPTTGGTAVTITGTNFVAGATVLFGSTAATGVTVLNATTLTAVTPARSAGTVNVSVTAGGQTGTKTGGYTFVTGAPTVTSVSPTLGPKAGGTLVTVTGSNFVAGATLALGGVPATGVQVTSATTLTAYTGAYQTASGGAAVVDVAVTTANGTGTKAAAYTYVNLAPTISTVSPPSGLVAGGTTVTIVGTNFVAGATLAFGTDLALKVVVVNATTITAETPAHAEGVVDVKVVNPDMQVATATGAFTFVGNGPTTDTDGDGMPDVWENQYGLDPNDATGDQGAAGDPDGDGVTNLTEMQQRTHPRGFNTRYFAEGVSTTFFDTVFAFANAGTRPAIVLVRFLRADGITADTTFVVEPMSRYTLPAASVTGLTGQSYSTTIESDEVVVADRTVSWDATGYGAHAETAIVSPAPVWYLAEGATHSGFDLFYLIQNPNPAGVQVQVKYLLPKGAPLVKTYTVGANSRYTIWVDLADPSLANTDVSAIVTAIGSKPIIVERSMYSNAGGRPFGAGHNGAGVTAPATRWFLAEGATGDMFDLFVLIANPGSSPAAVKATYLLPNGGTVTKNYTVPASSRYNVWVDLEDAKLANTSVSTIVESTNNVPIIVERAMWWPGPTPAQWRESHNSAGTTQTGTRWVLAEGEDGGPQARATYVLVANTSAYAGSARVQLLFEDGTTVEKTVPLPANSRVSLAPGYEFPTAKDQKFAVVVESLGTTPAEIVVERAMYWNANGEFWAAGTNALGTIVPIP